MENNGIKNLKTYDSTIKKVLKKGKYVIIAIALVLSVAFGVNAYQKGNDTSRNREKIATYYGVESNENTLLRCLDTLEKLDDLSLDEYIISDSNADLLTSAFKESYSLDKVDSLINEFNNSYLSRHDIDNDIKYCKTIVQLKAAKVALSKMATDEFEKLYDEHALSVKQYVAEFCGIDPSEAKNIRLRYDASLSSGEINVDVLVINPQTHEEELAAIVRNNRVIKAVYSMVDMQKAFDNIDEMKTIVINNQLYRINFEEYNAEHDIKNKKAAQSYEETVKGFRV